MNRSNLLQLTIVHSLSSTHSLDDNQARNPVEEFLAFLTLWAALSQALPLSAYDPHYHREQRHSTAYMKKSSLKQLRTLTYLPLTT